MTEKIISAAIYHGGIISLPPPARHHTILHSMDFVMRIDVINVPPEAQGFLTDTGRFVNRVEAYYIAWKAGQIIEGRDRVTNGQNEPRLFSEDLW